MTERKPAEWTAMDDEHTNDSSLYSWGDWYIARHINRNGDEDGWNLIVSSGAEYGPFSSLDEAKKQAENVRGD